MAFGSTTVILPDSAMIERIRCACPTVTKSPPASVYDTVVHISVGEPAKVFAIHRGLLCHYSTYFQSAFNGNWVEADDNARRLEGEDVEVFQIFHDWLYNRRLFDPDEAFPRNFPLTGFVLCRVFLFADRRGVTALKNATINALYLYYTEDRPPYPDEVVHFVYENTTESSVLRKVLVDLITYMFPRLVDYMQWVDEDKLPVSEYMRDLEVAFDISYINHGKRYLNNNDMQAMDRAQYFEGESQLLFPGSFRIHPTTVVNLDRFRWSNHYKWVIMLIVLFIAFLALAMLGIFLKRRHARRRDMPTTTFNATVTEKSVPESRGEMHPREMMSTPVPYTQGYGDGGAASGKGKAKEGSTTDLADMGGQDLESGPRKLRK
ncbi:hypothetical protein B0A49_00208 [Cryomyces minteri]|uniref:BTB domain-containing protein n=1 Tax=Cryomyces minteri TaxID=331657 RepID=A0A4U0XWI6_9PEZI|nr:hypothetical protein B0A49_00208 [Cryomyces minteri]